VRSPAAVFALETALLDLVSKTRGQPAWAALRGNDDATEIPLSALAEGATPEALVAAAERAQARGIRVVKVKVGGPDGRERDRVRLAALRSALGDEIALRLDANQSLPMADLANELAAFAEVGPELLEEPVRRELLASLQTSPIPLAFDESLMLEGWRELVLRGAERGTHAAVVLKPMALGGFNRCLEMAEVAREAGLAVIVTHVFDGPIGTAAAACLALAVSGPIKPCGLDPHGRFEEPLAAIGPTHVVPFTVSGLGVG
jgi:L-alanine-DL-glutamate epimerase-like enolase superfamily enzyme